MMQWSHRAILMHKTAHLPSLHPAGPDTARHMQRSWFAAIFRLGC